MLKTITYALILAVGIGLGIVITRVLSHIPTDAHQTLTVASVDSHGENATAAELDWCAEHRVPESECTQCHPDLVAQFRDRNDWCGEHSLPESHCRLCHPDLSFPQEIVLKASRPEPIKTSVFFPANAANCATDQAIIQFASAETAARAGLTIEQALETDELSPVEAPGEIRFDETQVVMVTVPVPLTVVQWLAEPGQKVSAGQSLAVVESPDVAQLEADYLKAKAETAVRQHEFARLTLLRERNLISPSEFELAQGAIRTSEAQLAGSIGLLRAAGLSAADLSTVTESQQVSPRYTLRASSAGVLVERKAQLGVLLAEGTTLAVIGDPGALWIEAQVREHDVAQIRVGQPVEFSSDGFAADRIGGTVIWVAQFLDEHTRTGTVRAKPALSGTPVRAHLFGRARFHRTESHSVAVPRDAVQWEGCCNVVFVQEAPDRYRPRKVTLERGEAGFYRVTSGLTPGEPIVVKGSYLLKTELKKGSIGAGCCGIEAKS